MSAEFLETQWSMVLAARDGSDTRARQALEDLCSAYWYPLYAYARRRGQDADGARDLTQAFFVHLLESDALQQVDRDKGRFRAFLLASMRNFLSHQRERTMALKRGGDAVTLSLDADAAERRFHDEPVSDLSPEQFFERRWGLTVMERAMQRLQTDASKGDGSRVFEALRPYLTGSGNASYREAAERLSMKENAVKTAVHRLRKKYGQLLRQEIAETVADPREVNDELRYLLTVIQPLEA